MKATIEQLTTPELLEVGRKAVEDQLIEFRDARMFVIRRNGLVIAERDGTRSDIIRFGTEVAVEIALKAMFEQLTKQKN